MNEKKYKEKLLEFLIESNKAKKREPGFVEAKTIVSEGLTILGLDANDILGFVKAPNERKIRRVRGAQAWFKKMYESGWKYAGNFEYGGLLNNGFVVMERELPNITLNAIREELEAIIKNDEGSQYIHVPDPEILRGGPMKLTAQIDSVVPQKFKDEMIGPVYKSKIPKAVKEPREGFESEVNDFLLDSQKEMKTDEILFFEETGKNAVWHGKPTKAFKEWKERLNAD